jgi:hypothetical protein
MAGRKTPAQKRATRAKQIEIAKKQIVALQLRSAGFSYQEIADRLHYATPQGAKKSVYAALKRTGREPSRMVRRLHLARLEKLLTGVWSAAINGDIAASAHALKIMSHIAIMHGIPVEQPKNFTVAAVQHTPEPEPILTDEEKRIRILEILQRARARAGLPAPECNSTTDGPHPPL